MIATHTTVKRRTAALTAPRKQVTMRIVIVEDDPLYRETLKLLLGGDGAIEIVGVFVSAEEALPAFRRLNPDIALVDLGLPGLSGIELISRIRSTLPGTEVLAHTVYDERETVFAAIKAGAAGYLLKGCGPAELIDALHTLYDGGAPMSQKIARRLIQEFQQNGTEEQYVLTPREKEIIKGIETGLAYKQLAARFNISRNTVHSHIKHIYDKLQARDREEALVKARRKGII